VGFPESVSVGLGVEVSEGDGLSVGFPQFGYKSVQPEAVPTNRAQITKILSFFIFPD